MSEDQLTPNPMSEGLSAFNDGSLDPAFMETPFSQFQALQVIQSNTNPEWIKTRNVGGKDLSYVSGDVVTRMLNKAFRYKWSFYVLETRVVESQAKSNKYKPDIEPVPQLPVVQVHGRLVVPGWGVREQWGAQPLSGGNDVQEHAFKSASTDAMKKCASMFGIALDLYGKNGMDGLSVTPHDYLVDDDIVVENLKKRLKKQRTQQQQSEPTPEPEAIPEPTPDPTPTSVAPAPVEPKKAIVEQPVVQTVAEPISVAPAAPVEKPVVEAPEQKNISPQWQQEDIFALREAKSKLGIADSNNEGLNVFTQEFFGMPEATYLNITPINVKDFLHFLSSKY